MNSLRKAIGQLAVASRRSSRVSEEGGPDRDASQGAGEIWSQARAAARLLAVFSTVCLATIAACLAMFPFGGASAALLAGLLVVAAFATSVHICGHLAGSSLGRPAQHNASGVNLEAIADSAWALRETDARLLELLNAQTDVICRRDGLGRITFANAAYRHLFCAGEDPRGSDFQPVIQARSPGKRESTSNELLQATTNGDRWFRWDRQRLRGVNGQGHEVLETGRDVTEERAHLDAVEQAGDLARKADRAKSRFLAAMSHEIRTPMNGILGMTGLLMETPQTAEQVNYCQAIDQSARTLLVLIDEILDFSKIEAGRLELRREPFELHRVVQSTVELLAPRAHEKGLEIAWVVDGKVPSMVVGDQGRLRQILLNLLSNAIRFTDQGGILVGCSVVTASDAVCHISLQVKDTGVGICNDAIGGIFGEFDQGKSPATKRRGGTGLGLTISRRLAIAMGGDIRVVSSPGRGSTFTVEIAFGTVEGAQAVRARWLSAPARKHVLLAFKRTVERRALVQNLAASGIPVAEADDPSDHRPIDAAVSNGQPIDVVIVDADCDPETAGRCLAAARAAAPDTDVRGIILIDGLARASLGPFREQGFQNYLVRPVRPDTLLQQIQVTHGAAGQVMREGECKIENRPAASYSGIRVLLAEDNEINALLAQRMLEKMGCAVVHAADGQQAVDAVKRSIEGLEGTIDLILMDLFMPKLDGIEATAAIRSVLAERGGCPGKLPAIVAVTANAFEENRRECLEAGLDDYLAKPFERAELEALIDKWCVQDGQWVSDPGGMATGVAPSR